MTDDDGIPFDVAGHDDRDDPRADGRLANESADGDGESGAVPAVVPDAALSDDLGDDEETVQPVELLVQLAREDEIDPWDIDVVAVTDKFLARLADSDLRTSARALFYASVLLRMKGDALLREEPEEPEEPEPWERPPDEMDEMPVGDPVDALEVEMERRLQRKRVRGQPETLEELVQELREAERNKWWKEARTYDTDDSPAGFRRGTQTLDYHAGDEARMVDEPTEADVTGTTHDEDIEAAIEDVRSILREQFERGREEVLYEEVQDAGGSRVMTYLALLFLAHRGQVALRQDELFGDLWIRDASAVAGTDEAVAD